MPRTSNPRRVRLLDPIEEARLQAEIAADPDAREATDEELAQMRPAQDVLPPGLFKALTKRGRPKAENKRVQLTLRVDPEVLAAYKAAGPGWQTRMNETLARGAAYGKLTEQTPMADAEATVRETRPTQQAKPGLERGANSGRFVEKKTSGAPSGRHSTKGSR